MSVVNPNQSAAAILNATFTRPGILAVETGNTRLRFASSRKIISISATVNTQPTGSAVIVDVLKNGTTVFTTQANRPTIAVGTNSSTDQVPDVTQINPGDYLTVQIAQVGSTVAGSDLTTTIRYQ
jgi:ssDNA-binding replication factor A large subunit